eukprot:CAMPEP_0113523390 /NCGR_PEP_ID=MMETSP0014_2-20120614/45681_1 /TAXON_ID=2857 /ORGANISM="Nitzschia sp." /LENGTH=1339 /DNA_ID=CAMNT_0000421479 /DNA_START=318 /DNA_END=4335 /DNA_ORIENTATION=+ /assembly_acc=CAM_ASM_000159
MEHQNQQQHNDDDIHREEVKTSSSPSSIQLTTTDREMNSTTADGSNGGTTISSSAMQPPSSSDTNNMFVGGGVASNTYPGTTEGPKINADTGVGANVSASGDPTIYTGDNRVAKAHSTNDGQAIDIVAMDPPQLHVAAAAAPPPAVAVAAAPMDVDLNEEERSRTVTASKRKMDDNADNSDQVVASNGMKPSVVEGSGNGNVTHGSTISTDGEDKVSSKKIKTDDSFNEKEDSLVTPSTTQATDVISEYAKLPPIASSPSPLEQLKDKEKTELEKAFDFQQNDLSWDDDWVGDLSLLDIEIPNPDSKKGEKSKKTLLSWAEEENNRKSLRLLNNLIHSVYNHPGTPNQAKRILADADPKSLSSLHLATQRVSYDPEVLKQDGWTITKATEPEGASGGSFRIGEKVIWQSYEGVVIAYLHDDDLGDLWKAMWVDDLKTFDLELEELEEGRKKYIRKTAKLAKAGAGSSAAVGKGPWYNRAGSEDFSVEGIEHGIVMATSYSRGARHGVFWPARVLHASELRIKQGKRASARVAKVDVVFLAPYWNSSPTLIGSAGKRPDALSSSVARHGEDFFNAGLLFEVESIDVSSDTIIAYPYDAFSGLDLDELLSSFKFSGLPKAAFSRFANSHRLALGLKTYSQQELKSQVASDIDRATASLMEAHPLAVQTAHFPSAVLHLPFDHILSQMPHPTNPSSTDDGSNVEPPLLFGKMLEAMSVPQCWGRDETETSKRQETSDKNLLSPPIAFEPIKNGTIDDDNSLVLNQYLENLSSLQTYLSQNSPFARLLKSDLVELARIMSQSMKPINELTEDTKKNWSKLKYKAWVVTKTNGEEFISSEMGSEGAQIVKDWRRCCERIFRKIQLDRLNEQHAGENGKGATWILTDYRCNLHLTSSECFERPIRLPAAISAARKSKGNIRFEMNVMDKYVEKAEKEIIGRAHKKSYIERMKKRCASASQDHSVPLTEDSDGNGGHDTKGSQGTWTAALAGVGAALQATDMIMTGQCLNVFCPTRPPGHHAGRELHAMKAISNGFCVLNTVACAAIYATMPLSQGGLGLSRVCVIDIDVHHGNGTQDVLCSTYDPRFLYVSMHAGGPMINGIDLGDDAKEIPHHLAGNAKKGIFPGRCGDISPHAGVLNIPLGGRVTAHALGTALVTKVSPTVEKFSPDLIIISAGFDAHKNDPLNMGGLSAQDFGTLTEVICKLAHKSCSGRILSVLEGGYGVPCCRPQNFAAAPETANGSGSPMTNGDKATDQSVQNAGEPTEKVSLNTSSPSVKEEENMVCLDLGSDMPSDMKDVVASYALQKKLIVATLKASLTPFENMSAVWQDRMESEKGNRLDGIGGG